MAARFARGGLLMTVAMAIACGGDDGGGGTPDANIISFDASADRTLMPPDAPTGLSATAGSGQVSLSWVAPMGATSYTIKRSTSAGGPFSEVAAGSANTTHDDTTVTNGTTYYYVVSATNADGEGPDSGEAFATPMLAPPVPANLTTTAGYQQVALTWTAAAGATSYHVKRGQPGQPLVTVATVTATSYTDTGLQDLLGLYFYTVSGVAGTVEGSQSGSVAVDNCLDFATGLSIQHFGAASVGFALGEIKLDADNVYWFDHDENIGADGGAIKRMPKAGGSVTVVASGLTGVNAFVIDDTDVYWTGIFGAGNGAIMKAPKGGGGPTTTLATGFPPTEPIGDLSIYDVFFPNGIAIDSTFVYWAEVTGGGAIRRVPKAGGNVLDIGRGLNFDLFGIEVGGGFAYGVEKNGAAVRLPLGGGALETLAAGPFLNVAHSVVLDGGYLYFAETVNGGRVVRVPEAGGTAEILASGLANPHYLALEGTLAFFDGEGQLPAVAKVPKSGGTLINATMDSCGGFYHAVAVDSTRIYMSLLGANGTGAIHFAYK